MYKTRLRLCSAISMLPAGSLGSGLLRMYKATRRACWMRWLETPKTLGKGRSDYEEAESETSPSAPILDIGSIPRCCQHVALGLGTREIGRICGPHAGSRPWGLLDTSGKGSKRAMEAISKNTRTLDPDITSA